MQCGPADPTVTSTEEVPRNNADVCNLEYFRYTLGIRRSFSLVPGQAPPAPRYKRNRKLWAEAAQTKHAIDCVRPHHVRQRIAVARLASDRASMSRIDQKSAHVLTNLVIPFTFCWIVHQHEHIGAFLVQKL